MLCPKCMCDNTAETIDCTSCGSAIRYKWLRRLRVVYVIFAWAAALAAVVAIALTFFEHKDRMTRAPTGVWYVEHVDTMGEIVWPVARYALFGVLAFVTFQAFAQAIALLLEIGRRTSGAPRAAAAPAE